MQQHIEQEQEYRLRPILLNNNRNITFNKDMLEETANKMIHDVLEGNTDPLGAFAELKIVKETIEEAMAKIEELAITELKKYGKQLPSNVFGLKIEFQEGRRKYDFGNNPSIVSLQERIKELQEITKAIKEPIAMPESGEMLFPATVTHTKESIKITIPK